MPNCSAPAAASAESGVAPLVWPTIRADPDTRLGGGADLGVGHAQQRHVGPGRRLAAAQRPRDLVAGLAQRGGQHPAEAAGTHHADALGRERLICSDRFHRPAGPAAGAAGRVMWGARSTPWRVAACCEQDTPRGGDRHTVTFVTVLSAPGVFTRG